MDKEIYHVISEYIQRLEALGIKVKKTILYGSHAVGKARKDSDIDLIVVSDDFKNMDIWERLCLLGRVRIGIKRPMEITLILSNTCAFKRVAFPLAAIIYSSHKVGADALISPQYRSSFGERALHFFITMMGVVTHYQQIELV